MANNRMTNQEAISMLRRFQDPEPWEPQITSDAFHALEMAIEALDEHKTGRWLYGVTSPGAMNIRYKEMTCSECGWTHSLLIPDNYCPNCGCNMNGKEC